MFLDSRITTGDCLLVNLAFGEERKIIITSSYTAPSKPLCTTMALWQPHHSCHGWQRWRPHLCPKTAKSPQPWIMSVQQHHRHDPAPTDCPQPSTHPCSFLLKTPALLVGCEVSSAWAQLSFETDYFYSQYHLKTITHGCTRFSAVDSHWAPLHVYKHPARIRCTD